MFKMMKALEECQRSYEWLSQENDSTLFSLILGDLIEVVKQSIIENTDVFRRESDQQIIYSIMTDIQHEILNEYALNDALITDAKYQLDIAVTDFSYKTIPELNSASWAAGLSQ